MLGPAPSRDCDRPVVTSLDRLVPHDHVYRHLDVRLALGFVREWVRVAGADRARPSIDPVVCFKCSLVMLFAGIRSERHLLAWAADRLSVR